MVAKLVALFGVGAIVGLVLVGGLFGSGASGESETGICVKDSVGAQKCDPPSTTTTSTTSTTTTTTTTTTPTTSTTVPEVEAAPAAAEAIPAAPTFTG